MRVADEAVLDAILTSDPVSGDPSDICPDMEYVCHDDEIYDLLWRRVPVPILSIFPEDELVPRNLDGETDEEARERFGKVRAWMGGRGGPDAALQESPIILLLDDGDLTLVDGWHRCVVAYRDFGATEVTAMVGMMPEPEDEPLLDP